MDEIVKKLQSLYKRGFFHIFAGGICSKLVAFVSSIVIVRLVDKEAYAALAYADNIYSYVTLVAGLGMASAVLKYSMGENRDKNDSFYRFSMVYGTLFQVVLLVLISIVVSKVDVPFKETSALLYSLLPYGFLYYWALLLQSFFRTELKNNRYAQFSFLQILLVFILTVLGIKIAGVGAVPFARTIALVLVIAVYGRPFFQRVWHANLQRLEKSEIRGFMAMAISLLVSNIFSMIMPLNETFLVNNMIADEVATANYKVANLIPSQLPFVTSSIVIYFFPILAKEQDKKKVWDSAKQVGRNIFLLITFISLVGFIITPFLIRFVYGSKYDDARVISGMLWIVYGLNAGMRMMPMNILPAVGCVRYNVILSMFSCIIHLVLDYIFIKNLGVYGAAFATGIVYLVSGVLYWYYLFKITR
ncbi:MAG: oligosaccharide flippase family protein [Lachnospiraceae bacterium]|jgi:O-antigen/teichoic acid export membrane protein|nr:oligosaccharide flippase family protein [Lachnospiraceae bacterium]